MESQDPKSPEAVGALKIQAACYQHAAELVESAERLLAVPARPNIAYHLALLGLEEIGKAGLVAGARRRGWRAR